MLLGRTCADEQDDKSILSHHLNNQLSAQDQSKPPVDSSPVTYIAARTELAPPSVYSSSLISQSTDPADQSLLVFPDWKIIHELENSPAGAQEIWDGLLAPGIGRSGRKSQQIATVGRRRSWTLPYRALILLCKSHYSRILQIIHANVSGSHKRRDKRCHIAAPLLRSALHAVLEKHDISIDETGSSLACFDGEALEDLDGSDEERDAEAQRRIQEIDGVSGGPGGEVGIFNINHLGGHRYAGVMLVSPCLRHSPCVTNDKLTTRSCFSLPVPTYLTVESRLMRYPGLSKRPSCRARLCQDYCGMLLECLEV